MSLKKWKLVLASLSVALFTACAGSSNDSGSSDTGSYTGSNETSSDNSSSYTGYSENQAEAAKPVVQQKPAAPKEVFDEKTLKKTQDEASAANEDNHKLRKEIFDARTKLGLPVQQPASSDEE
ncbi:MAG: hypothetical protein II565_01865 [Fibrobacter sp.]|nr:hypothetical protein [Fibrobacter sp.]MBQ5462947.1 hypothetical protein [Fibrobacter sp.]